MKSVLVDCPQWLCGALSLTATDPCFSNPASGPLHLPLHSHLCLKAILSKSSLNLPPKAVPPLLFPTLH